MAGGSTLDKKLVEKAIASALEHLNGTGPGVAKEMLKALTVRDAEAPAIGGRNGPQPDPELRETEDVPLTEDVAAYFEREVVPFEPEAWVDESKTRVGYEIPFTRQFYEYVPPRSLDEIDAEIQQLEAEIGTLRGTRGTP
jgi:type I restriction enzyme M protein